MIQGSWHHFNPVRVEFGVGCLERLADSDIVGSGQVLLVTTAGFVRRGQAAKVCEILGASRTSVFDDVTPNPEIDDLDCAMRVLRDCIPTVIVALGGGSVIDAAKAMAVGFKVDAGEAPFAAMLRHDHERPEHAVPVIAVPTTAGTGSEVTPFATVWDRQEHRKHSIAGNHVYPAAAIVDPTLTLSLPSEETLHTALDAISHSLESLWNRNRTPLSEGFSVRALREAISALPAVLTNPGDLAARSAMQRASLFAGMAISQTRTAIAHSISYPLTTHYGVPHGLACSFTLPRIISEHLERDGEPPEIENLMERARVLLVSLRLDERLRSFASQAQVEALEGEMAQPGRADNYVGSVEGLDRFVRPVSDAKDGSA